MAASTLETIKVYATREFPVRLPVDIRESPMVQIQLGGYFPLHVECLGADRIRLEGALWSSDDSHTNTVDFKPPAKWNLADTHGLWIEVIGDARARSWPKTILVSIVALAPIAVCGHARTPVATAPKWLSKEVESYCTSQNRASAGASFYTCKRCSQSLVHGGCSTELDIGPYYCSAVCHDLDTGNKGALTCNRFFSDYKM